MPDINSGFKQLNSIFLPFLRFYLVKKHGNGGDSMKEVMPVKAACRQMPSERGMTSQ